MRKLALAAIVAFSFAAVPANAFMIEPFIGLESGDYDDGSTTSDFANQNLGLRIGGDTLGFMYGFEYQQGSGTVEPSGLADIDVDTTDMGLYVGYELPIMLRAYLTYYFSHKAEIAGQSDMEGDGGMKLGVSYTGLPFIVINFEKMTRSFDEQGPATIDRESDAFMVGVGLPLP